MERMMINDTYALGGDTRINRIGYGAMRLTGEPGNFGPYADWEGGLALLRRAHDLGISLFDSAWSYGPEYADRIVGEALEGRDAVIATKGGIDKPAPGRIVVDGSRDTLLRQIDQALVNLRRDQIDLFQLHRPDPEQGIGHSIAALAEAQADGRIRHIGLSNVDQAELQIALDVAPIASVQNRFNVAERGCEELVDFAAERGIAFLPYGPLGAHPMQPGARLEPGAALAWLLRRAPNIIVIPGTRCIKHLEQNWDVWSDLRQKAPGAGFLGDRSCETPAETQM
jgi:pyridoxine 4-dehydrogenase